MPDPGPVLLRVFLFAASLRVSGRFFLKAFHVANSCLQALNMVLLGFSLGHDL